MTREPTSAFARRAWFLYETLLREPLDLPDAHVGNYAPALDPRRHVAPSMVSLRSVNATPPPLRPRRAAFADRRAASHDTHGVVGVRAEHGGRGARAVTGRAAA